MGNSALHRRKYFLLNKESDFQKGCGIGIETGKEGIALKDGAAAGVYYTKIFDSRERLMAWHRLVMEGNLYGALSVSVYAADSLQLTGRMETVGEVICGERFSWEKKDALLREYLKMESDNPRDILLCGVEGRFLWLKITIRAQGGRNSRIARIYVYFPKHTWLSWLPEIYQENEKSASFLERYMGIFQSMYEDMTEKIEKAPGLLEASAGKEAMLYELADWFSIEKKELWNREQLLYLVQNAGRMRRMRGTAEGILEMAGLYTGRKPYLVEYHKIKPYFDGGKQEQLLKNLYISHCWQFAILVKQEDMGQGKRLSVLEQVVQLAKPAHMECRIVVLKPYIFLSRHSYLGINSVLGQYRQLRLDGLCSVPFSVLAGENEKGGCR